MESSSLLFAPRTMLVLSVAIIMSICSADESHSEVSGGGGAGASTIPAFVQQVADVGGTLVAQRGEISGGRIMLGENDGLTNALHESNSISSMEESNSSTTNSSDLPPFWTKKPTDEMIYNSKLTLVSAIISLVTGSFCCLLYIYAFFKTQGGKAPPKTAAPAPAPGAGRSGGELLHSLLDRAESKEMEKKKDETPPEQPEEEPYHAPSILSGVVNPHNHFIFLMFAMSVLNSSMFITSASYRLRGDMHAAWRSCDTSFVIIQICGQGQVLLEIGFLLALVVSIKKPHWLPRDERTASPPFVFYTACFTLVIGIVSSFCLITWLPINPDTGTRGNPYGVSWCWTPNRYPWDNRPNTVLVVAQMLCFYMWVFLLPIIGVASIGYSAHTFPHKTSAALKFFFLARLLYVLLFTGIWMGPFIARLKVTPSKFDTDFQAFAEPFFPTLNAMLFLFTELFPRYCFVEGQEHHQSSEGRAVGGDEGQQFQSDTFTRNIMDSGSSSQALLQLTEREQNLVGIDGFIAAVRHRDYIQEREKRKQKRKEDSAVQIEWNEISQCWELSVDRSSRASSEAPSADAILASIQAVDFISTQKWILGAMMSFWCGFGDLTGAVLLGFYTAHITGNLGALALYFAGKTDEMSLLRHGWGLLVYFVGACLGNEFQRRCSKPVAQRWLLVTAACCHMTAFVSARGHEYIGSKEWEDSTSSYFSTFLLVFGYAQVNVYQRGFLTGLPIVSLQTGNTTALAAEFMAIIFALSPKGEARTKQLQRTRNNFVNVFLFWLGGTCSCLAYKYQDPDLCFAVPAFLSVIILCIGWGSV